MSTFWWTGNSGDGDFGTAGNFVKDDGTTNTLPADGDTLIFDGRGDANGVIKNVTAGLADLNQIKLAALIVLSSYTGNIGDGSNYVEISATEMLLQGTGICSILLGEYTGSVYNNTTCDLCVIDTDAGTVNLKVAQNDSTKSCKFTDLYVNAGNVYLNQNGSSQGVDVTNLYVAGGIVTIAAECFNDDTSDTYTNIYQSGGQIISDSPAELLEITGGEFTLGTSTATPTTAGCPNIATLKMRGGTFVWNATTANGTPKITNAVFTDGEFATTGKTKKQVGNSSNIWTVLRGASVDLDNPAGTVAFGTSCKVRAWGGDVSMPINTQVSW